MTFNFFIGLIFYTALFTYGVFIAFGGIISLFDFSRITNNRLKIDFKNE